MYIHSLLDAANKKWPNPTAETCGVDTFPRYLADGNNKLLFKLYVDLLEEADIWKHRFLVAKITEVMVDVSITVVLYFFRF